MAFKRTRKARLAFGLSALTTIYVIFIVRSHYYHDNNNNDDDTLTSGARAAGRRHLLQSDDDADDDDVAALAVNCTPRSLDQFPADFMSEQQRKNGGVVVHILLSLYIFAAIAIVCDDYFVASLEKLSTGSSAWSSSSSSEIAKFGSF